MPKCGVDGRGEATTYRMSFRMAFTGIKLRVSLHNGLLGVEKRKERRGGDGDEMR
jgi:hypothetical protein